MSQEHYWKEFYRLKVHVCYMELQLGSTESTDRALKIFLAITSSASIGGWAIWKDLASVWGAIIAASQVVNSTRQYFPYKERLRALSGLLNDLDELLIQVESRWLDISGGLLSEAEIRKALDDLRVRKLKAFKKYFPDNMIPDNGRLFQKAEEKALEYFDNFYPAEQ